MNVSTIIIVTMLIIASYFDRKKQIIPNTMIVIYSLIGIFYNLIFNTSYFWISCLNGVIAFLLSFVIYAVFLFIFKSNPIEPGDLKLIASLGFMLPLKQLLNTTIFAIFGQSVFYIIYLLVKAVQDRGYFISKYLQFGTVFLTKKVYYVDGQTKAPFVPFILIGYIFSLFFSIVK